jgi:hypothetical protein
MMIQAISARNVDPSFPVLHSRISERRFGRLEKEVPLDA